MKSILIIDNYDSFVYNITQIVEESNLCTYSIIKNDEDSECDFTAYDGIIISPGPGIPQEAGNLLSIIDKCKHSHSILGVCLGHQAIAEYFGGSLKNIGKPLHGYPSPLIILDNKCIIFNGVDNYSNIGHYHSWVVDKMPQLFEITATDDKGYIMAMKHKELPIFGLQFHPESIMTIDGKKMIINWIKSI